MASSKLQEKHSSATQGLHNRYFSFPEFSPFSVLAPVCNTATVSLLLAVSLLVDQCAVKHCSERT